MDGNGRKWRLVIDVFTVIRPKAQYQWRLCQSQAARCVANQLHPKVPTVLELARDSFRSFQESSRAQPTARADHMLPPRDWPLGTGMGDIHQWWAVRARQNTHSAEESHGGRCRIAAYQGVLPLNLAVDDSGKLQRRRIG